MSHVYPKASAFEAAGSGVTASPKFPALEEAVLDYWKKDNATFITLGNKHTSLHTIHSRHIRNICTTSPTLTA